MFFFLFVLFSVPESYEDFSGKLPCSYPRFFVYTVKKSVFFHFLSTEIWIILPSYIGIIS